MLCTARSGKGSACVPTLLTWPEAASVHDIKGENWTLTAGFPFPLVASQIRSTTTLSPLTIVLECGAATRKCATSKTSRHSGRSEGALDAAITGEDQPTAFSSPASLHVLYASGQDARRASPTSVRSETPGRSNAARHDVDDRTRQIGRSPRRRLRAPAELLNNRTTNASGSSPPRCVSV